MKEVRIFISSNKKEEEQKKAALKRSEFLSEKATRKLEVARKEATDKVVNITNKAEALYYKDNNSIATMDEGLASTKIY